ncbi:MAG: hypothetical protein QXX94_06240 [Candidatus Bathyarchaeia archaeon]
MDNSVGGKRKTIREARDDLQRIIDLCRSVEVKGLDPYLVDVEDLIRVIREYFPSWKNIEDLCLDTEALNHIASVVKLQSEWVKRRATVLYRDPFLIEEKIHMLPADIMAEIFLAVWHPIVEFEQLTIRGFREALEYWGNMLPLEERWKRIGYTKMETQVATREEIVKEGLLSSESFAAELEKMWVELKEAASKTGRVSYWDFIGSESYEETVRRAYLTSFLITYGYAKLEVHYLEDEIFILPAEKPMPISREGSELISFPIPVSFEEWMRWKEKRGV